MIFLYWFLGPLAAYACRYLFFLAKYRKGFLAHIKNKERLIKDAINAGFSYGIGLIFLFIIWLVAGRYDHYSTFLYFLSIAFIVMFIDPWSIIKNWKEKKPKAKKWVAIGFSFAVLLAETFIFNFDSISDTRQPSATYSLNSENVATNRLINDDGHIDIDTSTAYVYIDDVAKESDNLELCFADAVSTTVKVDILYRKGDSSDAYFDTSSYTFYSAHYINTSEELFNILGVPVTDYAKDILVRMNVDSARYVTADNIVKLTSISFSSPIPFSYSPIRMMGILSIALFFLYLPEIAGKYKEVEKEVKRAPYLILGGAAVVGVIFVCVLSCFNVDAFYVSYPLTSEELNSSSTDIYVALFDAIRKGQFHLDITPSDSLLALSNPYDPDARNGVFYLWDHAFYNGKYYSYYGILPVFLVSFPLYLLSGCRYVPNAFMLEVVGMVVLIPAFLLLILEIYRLVAGKVNWRTYIVLSVFALICSLMIMLITFKNGGAHEGIYHAPIIFGILNLDLFLSFALIAKRRKKQRMLTLGLCGLFFVFIIMSRPSLFLTVFLALPLFISILREKDDPMKKKLISFAPMVGVLLVGAIFVCYYNYARFGSILEFGSSYQLTVADARQMNYSLDKVLPSIVHYFFQGPSFYSQFPFLSCSSYVLSFDNAFYINGGLGVLAIPAFILGVVCLPFLFIGDKEHRARQAISIILPLVILLEAYTTYAKGGGICARYLLEIYHLATIGSVIAMLRVIELAKAHSKDGHKPLTYVLGGGFALFAISAFITLSLNFDSFDGMNAGDMNGFLLMWKEVFRSVYY